MPGRNPHHIGPANEGAQGRVETTKRRDRSLERVLTEQRHSPPLRLGASSGTDPAQSPAVQRREREYLAFLETCTERRQRSLNLLRRWASECERIYNEERVRWSPPWYNEPSSIGETCTIHYDPAEVCFTDRDADGDTIEVTVPVLFFIDPAGWERELRASLKS